MIREALAWIGGIIAGGLICYGGYRLYKYCKVQKVKKYKNIFEKKGKVKEKKTHEFKSLIADRSYVELLTAKELTAWFKENRSKVAEDAKMIITLPTTENMKGLGYLDETGLNEDKSIVQLFYDEETGNALLIRLVNYTDIDSNLQAKLIEQEGMIVVTD